MSIFFAENEREIIIEPAEQDHTVEFMRKNCRVIFEWFTVMFWAINNRLD